MIESVIKDGGKVRFPDFHLERHYMIPFMQKEGLPPELNHWQETVDDMLDGIKSHEPIYFMVDQAYVPAGLPHRRPGVHVDGYWCAGGWDPWPPSHSVTGHGGGGRHSPEPTHRSRRGVHYPRKHGSQLGIADWSIVDFSAPESILLASDVQGARAWTGLYDTGLIGDGGNADKVPVELLAALDLKAGTVYHADVGTLHASVPLGESTKRTMVRLNCPGVQI